MTFIDDNFLESDTDALSDTCTIEVPGTPQQTVSDTWGLGTKPTASETVVLACMEIPQRLYIDRTEGVTKSVSLGLCIFDPGGRVQAERRMTYRGTRYQITELLNPVQHEVKRVLLRKIGSGN